MRITAVNANEFNQGLDAWLAGTELGIQRVFEGLVIEAFGYLVENTPQWTGHAASNWRISLTPSDVGSENAQLRDRYLQDSVAVRHRLPPFVVGDAPAVNSARATARFPQGATEVFLVNPALSDDGKEYLQRVEANPQEYLRPENEGGHMVLKTLWEMDSRFGIISEGERSYLSGLRL